MTKPTVAFAHLGCEKNRVDTEHMLGLLAEAGYGVSADESDASVVVVNTCSFIQDARQESVRALGEVEIPWIRVHYAYPTGLTPEVLAAYREVPNVLPYLDLPLQHSHPEVLRAMNRPWQANVTGGLLQRIREQLPEAVLRTTFIVGFPGETELHFEHLLDFVAAQQFDHVGVFTFSAEEGTPAAELPDQVPAEVAAERKDRLMALQQPIATARNAAWIGRIVDVLIEQENPRTGEMIGRSSRFAPE
ncbi:MAG: radical SAM protein, partial [Cyanobium sp.]